MASQPPKTLQNYGLLRTAPSTATLQPIPTPALRPDYILVQVKAIALNPTDWTSLAGPGNSGSLQGCDYAGIVLAVGSAVTRSFAPGDKIAGIAHGMNDADPELGAFARYIIVKGDLQMRIPEGVSFETAASVGVGVGSAGYGLFKELGLPWPGKGREGEGRDVLIYGGSTATGSIAVQFAKLAGWRVITTCSPKHFEMMWERGADVVFDYRDPEVGKKIREATKGKLRHVFDTVAVESSAAICAAAFGDECGIYCNLLGIDCPREDVKSSFFLGYSMSGEEYIYEGDTYPAQPEDFEFARKFYAVAEDLWRQGSLKPHPQQVGSNGLLGAIKGMKKMSEGNGPSGEKLVYLVEESVWPEG